MFKNHIIYEDNVIVSITRTDEPYGLNFYFKEPLAPGLRSFEIQSGYMEVVDVEEILKTSSINEKTIFYGLEEIATENPVWKVFSLIKKLTPSFLQFYKLPPNKLHGVITASRCEETSCKDSAHDKTGIERIKAALARPFALPQRTLSRTSSQSGA